VSKADDRKMEMLEALRAAPAVEPLRRALRDRSNYFVSKAAALAGEFGMQELIPDLAEAFDRFMLDPVKSDPQCWAKNAIAKALKDLGYSDSDFFLRGIKHIQLEPVWGGAEDTAATLRGACALALVTCPLPRLEILEHLADLLAADSAKTVRADAAIAIAQLSGPDSALLLRFKALAGDGEPEVTGQCLTGLLEISPAYVPFVAGFLDSKIDDVPQEAAAALGACTDPSAVTILRERYRAQPDPILTRAILLSLAASRHADAADFLLEVIAKSESDHALHALQALAASRFRDDYRDCAAAAISSRAEPKLSEAFEKKFRG
jgi:HEAT repeat protein